MGVAVGVGVTVGIGGIGVGVAIGVGSAGLTVVVDVHPLTNTNIANNPIINVFFMLNLSYFLVFPHLSLTDCLPVRELY